MEKKIIGAIIGAFLGWLAEDLVAGLLRAAGMSPKAARIGGAVVGALVA